MIVRLTLRGSGYLSRRGESVLCALLMRVPVIMFWFLFSEYVPTENRWKRWFSLFLVHPGNDFCIPRVVALSVIYINCSAAWSRASWRAFSSALISGSAAWPTCPGPGTTPVPAAAAMAMANGLGRPLSASDQSVRTHRAALPGVRPRLCPHSARVVCVSDPLSRTTRISFCPSFIVVMVAYLFLSHMVGLSRVCCAISSCMYAALRYSASGGR